MPQFPDILGTSESLFQLGIGGPIIRASGTAVQARNSVNTAFAPFTAQSYLIGSSAVITNSSTTVWLRNTGGNAFVNLQCASAIASSVDSAGLLFLPLGSPEGLTLSRNATNPNTQIDVAAGRTVVAATAGRYVVVNAATFTKTLTSTWVAGSGNGGLAGFLPILSNTTYHVFALRSQADGSIDFCFDTSATAANKPSGYDARMIGSIMTDGSANIRNFLQIGDRFYWTTESVDLSTSALSTSSGNLQALTVPFGIRVFPIGRLETSTASTGIFVGTPGATISFFAGGAQNYYVRQDWGQIATNTSAQIGVYAGGASCNCTLVTHGFIHPRGAW